MQISISRESILMPEQGDAHHSATGQHNFCVLNDGRYLDEISQPLPHSVGNVKHKLERRVYTTNFMMAYYLFLRTKIHTNQWPILTIHGSSVTVLYNIIQQTKYMIIIMNGNSIVSRTHQKIEYQQKRCPFSVAWHLLYLPAAFATLYIYVCM